MLSSRSKTRPRPRSNARSKTMSTNRVKRDCLRWKQLSTQIHEIFKVQYNLRVEEIPTNVSKQLYHSDTFVSRQINNKPFWSQVKNAHNNLKTVKQWTKSVFNDEYINNLIDDGSVQKVKPSDRTIFFLYDTSRIENESLVGFCFTTPSQRLDSWKREIHYVEETEYLNSCINQKTVLEIEMIFIQQLDSRRRNLSDMFLSIIISTSFSKFEENHGSTANFKFDQVVAEIAPIAIRKPQNTKSFSFDIDDGFESRHIPHDNNKPISANSMEVLPRIFGKSKVLRFNLAHFEYTGRQFLNEAGTRVRYFDQVNEFINNRYYLARSTWLLELWEDHFGSIRPVPFQTRVG